MFHLTGVNELQQNNGQEDVLVLIDEDFSVVVAMNGNIRDEAAPAYLLKTESGTPKIVGSCIISLDGSWTSRLSIFPTVEDWHEFENIGDFDSRVAAIVHMWRHRWEVSFLPEQ